MRHEWDGTRMGWDTNEMGHEWIISQMHEITHERDETRMNHITNECDVRERERDRHETRMR